MNQLGQSQVIEAINLMIEENYSPRSIYECRKTIEQISHSVGLIPDEILSLIHLMDVDKIALSIKKKLVSFLIPKYSVPVEAVIKVIRLVISHQLSHSFEVLLMKWVCTVYSLIDQKESVACLYTVLFPLLRFDLLQPFVCELLYKMTKPSHVAPFRVKQLMALQSKMGPQPPIMVLLQLYASYRPDLVLVQWQLKKGFKSHGKLPNLITQVKVAAGLPPPKFDKKVESSLLQREITTYSDLSDMIGHFKGPIQISKMLEAPHRRVLFTSNLSVYFMKRVQMFLRLVLFTDSTWVNKAMKMYSRNTIMPVLLDVSAELKEGMPEVYTFISQYLKNWDGLNPHLIFGLISYWEIWPFKDFFEFVIKPLYSQFVYSPVDFQCMVIDCLTKLMKYWVVFEVPRLLTRHAKLRANRRITIFERETNVLDPTKEIEALIKCIDCLCQTSLHIHNDHPTILLYHILRFFQEILDLQVKHEILLHVPSKILMTAMMFTDSPFILSEVCGLFIKYKKAIEGYKKKTSLGYIKRHTIPSLNGYISDFCSMLAQDMAFVPKNPSMLFQDNLPKEVTNSIPYYKSAFFWQHHPALLGELLLFAEKSDKGDNILPLDDEETKEFLHHLVSSGFGNVFNFLNTFVRNLYEEAPN